MSKVYAEIKNKDHKWIEDFKEGFTEKDIKQIIDSYNATLRPHELKESLLK